MPSAKQKDSLLFRSMIPLSPAIVNENGMDYTQDKRLIEENGRKAVYSGFIDGY